ncbi:hypothetical protein BH24CHL6_BH24CHL6_09840 [soil metagenome]
MAGALAATHDASMAKFIIGIIVGAILIIWLLAQCVGGIL